VEATVQFQPDRTFLDEVEQVARAGAEALMPFWRTLKPEEISEKSRNDLVSAADHAAEAAILKEIEQRFPDHAVLAEESGWTRRLADRPTWIVDPLDGTTNFVHGIPQFAVSVGVAVAGRVDFGVILDPVKNDVFCAARGDGATWNGRPCRVTSREGLKGALVATGFPFRAHELLDPYLAIFREVFLRCKAIRRPGAAALDLAYTACGLFDGFFEFRLSPWDLAAGSLLVEEAGGVVSDMDGGRNYLSSGNMVCGPTGVHAELLQVIRGHRSDWRRAEAAPAKDGSP
jgi:myo-inositol-1(or 4)-monophosphatase